jgi:hypothetical protein
MKEREIRERAAHCAQICTGLATNLLNLGRDGDEAQDNLVFAVDEFLDDVADLIEALDGLAPSESPLRMALAVAAGDWDSVLARRKDPSA